jgi:hypothetical protein
VLDGSEGFGLRAAREVKGGIFREEEMGEVEAYTGIAAGYEVDLYVVLECMRWIGLDSCTFPV